MHKLISVFQLRANFHLYSLVPLKNCLLLPVPFVGCNGLLHLLKCVEGRCISEWFVRKQQPSEITELCL